MTFFAKSNFKGELKSLFNKAKGNKIHRAAHKRHLKEATKAALAIEDVDIDME